MNIFVDESGTFLPSAVPDSWSSVVAYVSPETDRARIGTIVKTLRLECGDGREVKLREIPEGRFANFLQDLSKLHGIAFAVAAETHLHTVAGIAAHRDRQADKVVEYIDKMLHEVARQGLRDLSTAIRCLPPQLYTQLICQVELFHRVLTRAVSYYALRYPATLGKIRWRIDRKDVVPTAYEDAFRRIVPALLQSQSLRDPMIMIKDAGDYRFFKRYEYPPGEAPTYLNEEYGIPVSGDVGDVGKMLRDDFKLVDSSEVAGVQVADLLASGLRRALRGRFDHPDRIAALLGANMVGLDEGKPSLQLIALAEGENAPVSDRTATLVRLMQRACKPYLPKA